MQLAQRYASGLVSDLGRLKAYFDHVPCTVKKGWLKPAKPAGDYRLCVNNAGDGWAMHWWSDTEKEDYLEIAADADGWPFNEDIAYPEDWELLGVEVIS